MKKIFYLLPIFFICLVLMACSSKPKTYTITYHLYQESETTVIKEYQKNEEITSSYFDASLEGFEPVGWYKEKGFINKVTFPYTVTKNEDFYLKWEKKTVTITWVDGKDTEQLSHPFNQKLEKPIDPTEEGYTFKGWSTDANSYMAWDFNTPVTTDLTLYAFYEEKLCSITFVLDDVSSKETIAYGNKITKENPSKEGYTFKGWSTDANSYKEFDLETKITTDLTLYAFFQIQSYTVTFELDRKTTTTTVEYNHKVEEPKAPSKTGYHFIGWYLHNSKFDFNTPITEEITLTAKFEINTYTVTFKNGNNVLSTELVHHNSKVSKLVPPSILGSKFIDWYKDKELTVLFDFDTLITEDTSIYGKFEDVLTHKVTLVIDGVETSKIINDGDCLTIETPVKTGYTFQNWNLDNTPFDITTPITKDIHLIAIFKINTYKITFKNDSKTNTITAEYNTKISEPEKPTKEGYSFDGWYNGLTKFDFNTTITKDLTLTAKFTILTYTVTFTYEDGSIIDQKQVKYKQLVTISDPTMEGYSFIGWFNGTEKFELTTLITENLILVAKFEQKITYTVTFKNDSDIQTIKVEKGNLVKEPDQPTKEGFSFVGWYENEIRFDFSTPIESNITLTAKFEEAILKITSASGYNEGLYIEFEKLDQVSLSDYSISYKLSSSTEYQTLDKELIREKGNIIRCDIVGLPKGTYDVQITVEGKTLNKSFKVSEDDRSGYAHFGNTTGVGAYKNDGSLKDNAVVVYVSDETKNTVTAKIGSKTYTGLVNIIKACTSSSYALDVRILGEIQTTQWNKKSHGTGKTSARQTNLENTFKYTTDSSGWDESTSTNYSKLNEKEIISKGINSMSDDLAKGITQLKGLTNQVLRSKKADSSSKVYEYDSYYNMLDVTACQNITIEGIGTDAAIFQWGFAFKKCNSIEIKNIRFHNYTEDAVGFEGSSSDINYGYYWVHNCTFDLGVNNWDVCYEADKGDGDGSSDVKYCHNVTISYTQYNSTHKTNLIGSSDTALQYNITLHHNFYNKAGSRLPLIRQANIHIYNNYYYGSTSYSHSIRANCYAFVENNYYDGGKNPYELVSGGVIKAYNNIYNNVTTSGNYKKENTVTSRTQTVSSTCKPDGKTNYSNFDTNSKLFYYNEKGYSDVQTLLDTKDVPQYCKTYSGVLKPTAKGFPESSTGGNETPDPILPPVSEEITWENVITQDFNTAVPIQEISYSPSAPTTKGFYYSYNTSGTDTGSTTTNNMKIENGMLKINDTSKVATFGYYIFDQNYSSGKVRISLDFIPQKSSGSWTMIHFLDGQSNLGIRTDSNKTLGYTTDGSTVNTIASKAMEPNKTYTIILIIDYDRGSASIEINGEKIAFSYSNTISGIMFQTANADTARSFSIDNIKIDRAK